MELPSNVNAASFGYGATEIIELRDIDWRGLVDTATGCLDLVADDIVALQVVDQTECPGAGFRFKAVKLDPATVSVLA
jgi:hypothetical protein